MLRRTLALIPVVALSSLFACKARDREVSAVKDAESGPVGTAPPQLDEIFARFDKDVAEVEQTYLIAGDVDPSRVEGLALTGQFPNPELLTAGLRDVASKLRVLAKETPDDKRDEVTSLAIELEVMAIFVQGDMPGADTVKINAALARAQAILDNPPKAGNTAEGKPTPIPDPLPQPIKQPEINYDNVTCATYAVGRYLPRIVESGEFVGTAGFQTYSNCTMVSAAVNRGLVCSISPQNKVSPFFTRSKRMLGPPQGFQNTVNCVKAVKSATNTICLVDNSQGGSNPSFAKYDIATGKPVDWWFYDHDKCMRGDKAKDVRTLCMERCEAIANACKARASTALDRIDCNLSHIECMQNQC